MIGYSLVLISLYLAIFQRTGFVIWYLLAFTSFLGFYEFDTAITASGYAVGFLALNLSAFIGSAFHFFSAKVIPRHLSLLTGGLFVLTIYGIVRALALDPNLGIMPIIEGKHFLSIAFLAYLMTSHHSIDQHFLRSFISYLGIYLSAVMIANTIIGITPPAYIIENPLNNNIRVQHPSLILLAFFVVLANTGKVTVLSNLTNSILLIGLYLSGHVILLICALAFGLVFRLLFLAQPSRVKRNVLSTAFVFVAGASLFTEVNIAQIAIFSEYYPIDSPALEGSIRGRIIQNEHRWQQVGEYRWIGSGFLHGSSNKLFGEFGYSTNRFMSSLAVIDSGYLNLILIFGFLGTIFYIIVIAISVRFLVNSYESRLTRAMICFIMAMAVVNTTWSVLSFTHGLIPLFLGIWLAGVVHNGQCMASTSKEEVHF